MNKVPFNRILKTHFIINYIELLDKEFYNIQRDLIFSKNITYTDKQKIIYNRSIINNNINLGYSIIKYDILKNEISNEDIIKYIKDTSGSIKDNYDKTLLQKYKEKYNIDIKDFTNRVMLDKYE